MALNLLMLFSAGTTQLEQLGAEPLRGELSDYFIHWRLSGSHTHLRVGLFSLLGLGLDPRMEEAGSSFQGKVKSFWPPPMFGTESVWSEATEKPFNRHLSCCD